MHNQTLEKQYKTLNKAYKKACKHAKQSERTDVIASLKEYGETSKYYKELTADTVYDIGVLHDGLIETQPGHDTIKHLYQTHFPAHTKIKPPKLNPFKQIKKTELTYLYRDLITTDKVKLSLTTFEHKKSPGPDEFKPIMFQHMPQNVIKIITQLYKISIALHHVPKIWRDTRVIFIPKPGKDSYNKAKSFRPISLSNYLLKGLERLYGWHMKEQLIELSLIHI